MEPVYAGEPPGAPAVPWAVPAPAPPPPAEFAPPISPQYGDWARQQRVPGNVYGGAPPGHDLGQVSAGFESSDSLSGQILGDGVPDEPRRGSKAVILIMITIGLLVIGGFAAAIAYLSGAFH